MQKINLRDLIDKLKLRVIVDTDSDMPCITVADLNRPGLALSGFFDSFAHQRIQIFGRGEVAYLDKISKEGQLASLDTFFSYHLPCCIFTHNLDPSPAFLDLAEQSSCPIL